MAPTATQQSQERKEGGYLKEPDSIQIIYIQFARENASDRVAVNFHFCI